MRDIRNVMVVAAFIFLAMILALSTPGVAPDSFKYIFEPYEVNGSTVDALR